MRLLTALWALPVLGGFAALGWRKDPRGAALGFSVLVLLACALPLLRLDALSSLSEAGPVWAWGIRYRLGVDGLSLALCGLTAFLTVISILGSWKQEFSPGYWAAFLFLEGALMGVFLARDVFFFYIFWEAVLIPMFFIIGLWGSEGRRHAAIKFFLFTFFGSVFLLLGLLALVTRHHQTTGVWTWDMDALRGGASGPAALATFAAVMIGFAVKVPVVPLHTWLPDAHTEAPAAGSVMLAGVLLKMGVYGIVRVALPAFPELSRSLLPWLGACAAINVIYGALCAMAQTDLKRLVAYSSVAHLGFCLLGVFSRTPEGLAGGSLQLINHGLTTGALFLMVGFLYERSHRRGIADFGELAGRAPWLAFFFGFSVFASIGLPGLNGFVGEFMSLAGMTRVLPSLAVAGVAGVTMAAAYLLPAYQAVFWGAAGPEAASARVTDLDSRERGLLWSLSLLMLLIGLCPGPWLRLVSGAAAAAVLP
ncbi:MAG: NADH-quinone oxidoreductase subunit M [Elusimicrobia bacterium]|nr:NADH-quinone oxidoreductase subunit M [Elusimicrobiota bacterium]